MSKLEQIESLLAVSGSSLASKDFKNSAIPILCKFGHPLTIRLSSLKVQSFKCWHCVEVDLLSRVRSALPGYTLVSHVFSTLAKTVITLACPLGHEYTTNTGNIIDNGSKCPTCHGTPKKDAALIERMFDDAGYTARSPYIGTDQKMSLTCPSGHEIKMFPNKFAKGQRCGVCYGNVPLDRERVVTELANAGFTLLHNGDLNSKQLVGMQCPEGHVFPKMWNSFQQGHRCPICVVGSQSSMPESELLDEIRKLGFNPIPRDKSLGFEVDILVPEAKLAIEYCGLYWHSFEHMSKKVLGKADQSSRLSALRMKHQRKWLDCQKFGITLVTIFEDEYLNRPEVVLGRLRAMLGVPSLAVAARRCTISECPREESRAFLSAYHLQGDAGRVVGFKISSGGKILGVLTIGHPSRKHTCPNGFLEVKRMAFLPGCHIQGGASKLFSAVYEWCKSNGIAGLVSFADLRWGSGKVYEKCGFTLVSTSKPSPHLTNGRGKRWSIRSMVGKTKSDRVLTIYDAGHNLYSITLLA